MPIPRFKDKDGGYDICLFCEKCGWAIVKDTLTQNWTTCRSCGNDHLVTLKNYYSGPGLKRDQQKG